MIVQSVYRAKGNSMPSNCRVRGIADLLAWNGVSVNSDLLYLLVPKPLFLFCEVPLKGSFYPFLASFYEDVEEKVMRLLSIHYEEASLDGFAEIKSKLDDAVPILFLCDAQVNNE